MCLFLLAVVGAVVKRDIEIRGIDRRQAQNTEEIRLLIEEDRKLAAQDRDAAARDRKFITGFCELIRKSANTELPPGATEEQVKDKESAKKAMVVLGCTGG